MKRLSAVLAVILCVAGCTSTNDNLYTAQIVVQGYLYANEPCDSIVVSHTLRLDDASNDDRVSNAIVTVSEGDSTFAFAEDRTDSIRGRYKPLIPFVVKPGVTYRLRVEALGQIATSETTVPAPIHLDSVTYRGRTLSITGADTIEYPTLVDSLGTESIYLAWSSSPGSAGYALEALAVDSYVDPIVLDGIHLDDSTAFGRYRFLILSQREQVIWLQFTRYGLNLVRALAIDKNYQDFVTASFTSGSQYNNSTLHVAGGLGVFASAARASKRIYLK